MERLFDHWTCIRRFRQKAEKPPYSVTDPKGKLQGENAIDWLSLGLHLKHLEVPPRSLKVSYLKRKASCDRRRNLTRRGAKASCDRRRYLTRRGANKGLLVTGEETWPGEEQRTSCDRRSNNPARSNQATGGESALSKWIIDHLCIATLWTRPWVFGEKSGDIILYLNRDPSIDEIRGSGISQRSFKRIWISPCWSLPRI